MTLRAPSLATGLFVSPNGHQLSMSFRLDTNDYNTLIASMDEDEYHLRGETFEGTAIDCGGYLGSVGIGLAADNPDLRVIIIEPVPDNADLIERNIDANGLGDRITLIRGAIGKGGEDVEVWYGYRGNEAVEHHRFVGNSTLAYDNGGELQHETATYVGIGLADIVNMIDERDFGPYTDKGGPAETHPNHEPIRIALLKVDTEGAEWAFLDSPEVWRLDVIVGEVHPVRGHSPADLLGLLDKTHVVTFEGPEAGPCGFRAVRR